MELTPIRKVPPFDLKKSQNEKTEKVTLTLWVPLEVKKKYDLIQDMSGNKFSKHLVKIVEAEVEFADNQAGA